ncbi:MAG: hypothetical protein TH68_03360 [Candidatus Synechococcus spongiarum 142]|uniref:MmeI-like N-terminal domain-containing protein n=1 Tax=Candidatus Synechococcus spongiarum 142 TaxID=1608213 RepID=A0A6N3X5K6_9SYNE|nr:MAG: hypothetical protein TH68_03360 [Candidatus Synechococcus spongiarum 142]
MELSSKQKDRIAEKAKQFVERWTKKHYITESQESQTFINEFFDIFDIDRFTSDIHFEYNISKNGNNKRIDAFWPGVILIENKTPGTNLNKASEQVREYLDMIKKGNSPKYVLINNFRIFKIYPVIVKDEELTLSECKQFNIKKLPEKIHLFYYLLDHKHEKIIREIIYKTRYGILILASSLSLTLGYVISDGQPRAYLESVIEESSGEEFTR